MVGCILVSNLQTVTAHSAVRVWRFETSSIHMLLGRLVFFLDRKVRKAHTLLNLNRNWKGASSTISTSIPFMAGPHDGVPIIICHRSTTLEFTPSQYPKLVVSTNIPFYAQNPPSSKLCSSLARLFPISLPVYPDFNSCYSTFMLKT